LKLPAVYAGIRMLLVAPSRRNADRRTAISAAGQEQGNERVFLHQALAAKGTLNVSVSGIGSPQAADGSGGQGQQAQEGNSRTQGPQVDLAPAAN